MIQQLDRRFAVAVPAMITLLIGGFQLGRAPLWRDELATWSAATRPLGDLWHMLSSIDAVSGPYYLFMHGWIRVFGDSAIALRLPSLLAMAGAAAVTSILGARLANPATGLVAGLLFAVAPSTSRYGQEARGYAFATLFAVVATLLLLRAFDRPTIRRFALYGLALVGLGLANLVALLLVAGHAAGPLRWRRRGPALGWAAAVAGAGVLLSPLALLGRGQRGTQLDWVPTPGLGDLVNLPGSVLQTGAVGGTLVVLAALGWARSRGAASVLALSVVVPAVLLFVGGRLGPLWVPRYLAFTVPLLCVLAAVALRGIRLPAAVAIVAVVAALGAPAQADLRRTHEWPRSAPVDYPAAVAVIRANRHPGDGIVYEPRAGWKMLDVAVAYGLGRDAPRDVLLAQSADDRGELRPAECADQAACLARAGADRVWLLAYGDAPDPLSTLPGPKGAALRADYKTAQTWHKPGLTVSLLTRA